MIELVILITLLAITLFIFVSLLVLFVQSRQAKRKPKSLYYFADTDIEDNDWLD